MALEPLLSPRSSGAPAPVFAAVRANRIGAATRSTWEAIADFFVFWRHPCQNLLRTCVFQLGLYNNSNRGSTVATFLMERYALFACKRRCCHPSVETERVHESLAILEQIGGVRKKTPSLDGKAQLEYMLLTQDALRAKVEEHGGRRSLMHVKISLGKVVECPPHEATECWDVLRQDPDSPAKRLWTEYGRTTLSRMGWKKETVDGQELFLLDQKNPQDLTAPAQKPCFLRCHTPDITYPFERKTYVGPHLALGDVCLFDPRGTVLSEGEPSEGGYYLDAETIYQRLTREHRYLPQQIFATGFCSGAALAVFLATFHHDQGVNFVTESTTPSLRSLIQHESFIPRKVGLSGLPAVISRDPAITSLVPQDYFNTLEKLENLSRRGAGKMIVVQTENDTFLPPQSGQKIYNAAKKVGQAFLLTHRNGRHSDQPLTDPVVWRAYKRVISQNPEHNS